MDGPKGKYILSFLMFIKPMTIPMIHAKKKATKLFSHPIYIPITNSNLISPPPISSFFKIFSVTNTKTSRGIAIIIPFKSAHTSSCQATPSVNRQYTSRTTIASPIALLEIICFCISVTDIQSKKTIKNTTKTQYTIIPHLVFYYRGR